MLNIELKNFEESLKAACSAPESLVDFLDEQSKIEGRIKIANHLKVIFVIDILEELGCEAHTYMIPGQKTRFVYDADTKMAELFVAKEDASDMPSVYVRLFDRLKYGFFQMKRFPMKKFNIRLELMEA